MFFKLENYFYLKINFNNNYQTKSSLSFSKENHGPIINYQTILSSKLCIFKIKGLHDFFSILI